MIAPSNGYPACNVAMYYDDPRLGQPGEGKPVYLYAHARTGRFLPLPTSSKVSNGKEDQGMIVEVWTNDDQRFLYVITQPGGMCRSMRRSSSRSRPRASSSGSRHPRGWDAAQAPDRG